MPNKIFISYRRQDSAANALGIGQYLEHEFGRKNVFIDIDMRAGTKFPKLLEQRLAECKVMLVLIGPTWLDATDERGRRRLDDPDDWVRLEIAHALNRDITVIPVRVNGAELPLKEDLPSDIQGLLDHQAVSVTLAGFRNEMSGLVRDIRAISSPQPWRRFGAIALGLLLLLTVFVVVQASGFFNAIERIRFLISSVISGNKKQDDLLGGQLGEWVMFAYATPIAGQPSGSQQFRPSSVKIIGDRVAYETRYPLISTNTITTTDTRNTQGAFEVVVQVIDCKMSVGAMAERTIYNSAKVAISHFKWGEPSSLDLSIGGPIASGSILNVAQHILCNEKMRTPLLLNEKVPSNNMKFLARTAQGDGNSFYGPVKRISDEMYEVRVIIQFDADHPFTELYPPGITIVGLLRSFSYRADLLQVTCTDRKTRDLKWDHYDAKYDLAQISLLLNPTPVPAAQGSPLDLLVAAVCGVPVPVVQGTYEGTNNMTYANKGHGEQKISLMIEQMESELNVTITTAEGGQGKGTGKLTGAGVEKFLLKSTTPGCPGSYEASLKFADEAVSWFYKGEDCNGPVEGQGMAKRTKL